MARDRSAAARRTWRRMNEDWHARTHGTLSPCCMLGHHGSVDPGAVAVAWISTHDTLQFPTVSCQGTISVFEILMQSMFFLFTVLPGLVVKPTCKNRLRGVEQEERAPRFLSTPSYVICSALRCAEWLGATSPSEMTIAARRTSGARRASRRASQEDAVAPCA